ncbi:MAG: hypothetical protein NPINA01_29010 [Nitrospinaceae bacterium]|nr:MAG: hypothetical protein NPINA01_29010 [Nitrospinaceae bacterium]
MDQRRSIQALATKSGELKMSFEFILHQTNLFKFQYWVKNSELDTRQREKFLLDGDYLQIQSPVVVETLQQITSANTDRGQTIDFIFDYLNRFADSNEKSVLNVPSTLQRKKGTTLDRSLGMVALSRAAGIPARLVAGFVLKEDFDPKPHYWVEVNRDHKWLAYDVHYGFRHDLPASYLPMRRNGEKIVQVWNGDLLQLSFGLEREFDYPYLPKSEGRSVLSILDLTNLPMDARDELALLLLLPFCVLISSLWRNFVGLKSYGVFTSTLLALALVYNDKLMTLVMFLVVCSLAMVGRSIFPGDIKRKPRLAIIFTLIALVMALSVSTLDYFDLSRGGKVILLPIIILTSLVDNMYRTIEDNGLHIAMRRLLWTVCVALLCLPVIQFQTLGRLLISYPEVHLITLGLFLLISTYEGRQLIHLPLIKLLAESEEPEKNANLPPMERLSEKG